MPCGPPLYLPLPTGCGGTGGGSSGGDLCCKTELASLPNLKITIPDGANTGVWTGISDGTGWGGGLAGTDGLGKLRIECVGGVLTAWRSRDPGTTATPTSVVCDPFLLTFPGAIFGSTGSVSVELA